MKKIGRNESCPCGSGKKYKKCCAIKKAVSSQNLQYRRLSDVYHRLENDLKTHAEQVFGEKVMLVALEDFLLWHEPDDELDAETIERSMSLFFPWFLFNWEYSAVDAEFALSGPEGWTVAELYAEARAEKLDPVERGLIEGINRKPFSFWEVLSVDKSVGMDLKDIISGRSITVQERSASESLKPGDLILSRAVSVDGVGMLIGAGETVMSPVHKLKMIALRKRIRDAEHTLSDDELNDWDAEIFSLYFDIEESLYAPAEPDMVNTDGHPMEFHSLVYDISSADTAFRSLCDLCVTETAESLCEAATRDDAGRIIQGEITWSRSDHRSSSGATHTVLGRILIDGNRLTAKVNSAERAAELRLAIDRRLGDNGRFKVQEIQDLDAALRDHDPNSAAAKKAKAEHDALMLIPEVREQVAALMSSHWERWVDIVVPALGATPRDAVKTGDGREAVEALLRNAERDVGQDPFTVEANRKGAQRARELLGLKPRQVTGR